MVLRRLVNLLITAILAFVLVVACARNPNYPIKNSAPPTENCRKIQHTMGEACIPLHPQRVVTIHSSVFANALALNVKPIATAYDMTESFPSYLRDEVDGVELIGDLTQPSLERILELKPDLILGNPWSPNNYQQLSKIAPTVMLSSNNSSWKQDLTELARILNREEKSNRLIEEYWKRIEQLKQALRDRYPVQVSVAGIYPGYIYAYGASSAIGEVLNDAELQRPPSQSEDFYYVENISEEFLFKIDGDIIFFVTRGGEEGAEYTSEHFTQKPLWQNLKAVQKNQAHAVDYHWHLSDIIAINAILDDLFKYLVNAF